jgi:hypothetical protein
MKLSWEEYKNSITDAVSELPVVTPPPAPSIEEAIKEEVKEEEAKPVKKKAPAEPEAPSAE